MHLEFFLSGNCAENEYTCVADQKCILKTWLCDGEPDCAGGDDEAGCGLQTGEAACTCTCVCRGEMLCEIIPLPMSCVAWV